MVHAVVTLSCFIQHHFRVVSFSVNIVQEQKLFDMFIEQACVFGKVCVFPTIHVPRSQ